MTKTKYGILFSIELLHKYFTNRFCPDFTVTPSDQTVKHLKGHQVIVKQNGHLFYAGVGIDENSKPLPVPDEGMQLTFFLELNNPLFLNYTNLPLAGAPGTVYYFTNRQNNSINGKRFLSVPIAAHDAAKTYRPGDLSLNATGTLFRAVRTTTGVLPPANDAASSDWAQVDPTIDQNQYVSAGDKLTWMPSLSTYRFPAADPPRTAANISVWGYNGAAGDYSTLLLTKAISFANPAHFFDLELTGLPPGKYKLRVNEEAEQLIYINDELSRRNVFAVIHIVHESTLPAANQLLNASDALLSPQFSVYFLNRPTIWKYRIASGGTGAIQDNGGVFGFSAPAATVFSDAPIPLSEKALSLTLNIEGQSHSPIACASPQQLGSHTSGAETYYCSEIFLNY